MSYATVHVVTLSFLALVELGFAMSLSQDPLEHMKEPISYSVEMIRRMPHQGEPFTQGLEITPDGKYLVETSGSFPQGTESFVRLLDPHTGDIVRSSKEGLSGMFAEGIVRLPDPDGHWFLSTFNDKKVVEYDADLHFVATHDFPETGWGLTRSADGSTFLATNGSEYLMRLKPKTFQKLEEMVVECFGKRVQGLNELEMVDNFMDEGPTLLGNLYQTRLVLAVNPDTGKCRGVFDLGSLEETAENEQFGYHVANGLAYNKSSETLYVTGKNWKEMFEVRLSPDTGDVSKAASTKLFDQLVPALPVSLSGVKMEVSPGADSFLNSYSQPLPSVSQQTPSKRMLKTTR